ncbi:MAG: bifunctional riboflavin kinase/FAD synthetase [Nitrospiraceae bacterium]
MKITRGLADHKRTRYPILTIGNFDGQHRGHAALLDAVVQAASRTGGTPIALTFDPHPITVLSPGTALRFLMTMEEKLACFQESGIEEVVFVEFNKAFAALTPAEFVLDVLREGIGVRELFVGEQFAFGKGRSGTMEGLVQLGSQAGFRVHAVPAIRMDGEVVSSTRIRSLVQAGDVRRAAQCLGRPYALDGSVMTGSGRGEQLGWPTANLPLSPDRVIPADGVYATRTVWNKRMFESVSYIGTRPTFGPGERLLEVYLLDEQVSLYDEQIRVQFVERLREDRVFRTPAELAAGIDLDVARAREILKTVPPWSC